MSFDLYALDFEELPSSSMELMELMEDQLAWGKLLTPRLAGFVDALAEAYPWPDDDPDASVWASWPLGDSSVDGRCTSFNIVWSAAEEMRKAVVDLAASHGVTLYDPQIDQYA